MQKNIELVKTFDGWIVKIYHIAPFGIDKDDYEYRYFKTKKLAIEYIKNLKNAIKS